MWGGLSRVLWQTLTTSGCSRLRGSDQGLTPEEEAPRPQPVAMLSGGRGVCRGRVPGALVPLGASRARTPPGAPPRLSVLMGRAAPSGGSCRLARVTCHCPLGWLAFPGTGKCSTPGRLCPSRGWGGGQQPAQEEWGGRDIFLIFCPKAVERPSDSGRGRGFPGMTLPGDNGRRVPTPGASTGPSDPGGYRSRAAPRAGRRHQPPDMDTAWSAVTSASSALGEMKFFSGQ